MPPSWSASRNRSRRAHGAAAQGGGAIDGNPTYLFFVLFAPDNSAGLYLKALARNSRLFKQPQLRRAILAANGSDGIFRLISEEDAKY